MSFYVYIRQNYPVFEPAEGGYYVSASEVTLVEEFDYLNSALTFMHQLVLDALTEGATQSWGSDEYGFVTDKWGDITLKMPCYGFDYNGYIGEGWNIGIDVEKPQDRPYEGYR